MTPAEKAKELYDKYLPLVRLSDLWETYHEKAKQCALIAAEQAILYHPISTEPHKREKSFHQFWESVKEEITKL